MDIVAAARAHLADHPSVRAVLGYEPAEPGDPFPDPWLYQEKLARKELIEGSGRRSEVGGMAERAVAIVLKDGGGWTSPNSHNTMRFPRLTVEFWADPDRDDASAVIEELTARDKIRVAFEAVDKLLHFTMLREEWWPAGPVEGSLRITACTRTDEPEFFPVPDGDGVYRGEVHYALGVTGEWTS